jgi:hypothetical protein
MGTVAGAEPAIVVTLYVSCLLAKRYASKMGAYANDNKPLGFTRFYPFCVSLRIW